MASTNQAMASACSFLYEPLDPNDDEAFRLLAILPGEHEDPIECTIKTASLSTHSSSDGEAGKSIRASLSTPPTYKRETSIQQRFRKLWNYGSYKEEDSSSNAVRPGRSVTSCRETRHYECLSYAWGDDEAELQILLNKKPFKVSPTLFSALRHLRYRKLPRTMWIDAICIDQTSDTEKGKQIRFMQKIYSNADQVVVWLGDSTSDSELAISFAREIASLISPNGGTVLRELASGLASLQELDLFNEDRLPGWNSLLMLIERSWWRRAWVVQEVICAETVTFVCGSTTVSWNVLGQAIVVARIGNYHISNLLEKSEHLEFSAKRRGSYQVAFDLFVGRDGYARRSPQGSSCIKWLQGSRRRFCRLPHDKIYSILGLTSHGFRNAIDIDYTLPVEAVFRTCVKASIEESGSFDIITYSQHSVWRTESPSWMPDWRIKARMQSIKLPRHRGQWPPIVTFSPDLLEMSVMGKEIAKITEANLETRLIPQFERENFKRYKQSSEASPTQSTAWVVKPDVLEDILTPATERWDLSDFHLNERTGLNILLKVLELKWRPELLGTSWHQKTTLPQSMFGNHKSSRSKTLAFLPDFEHFTMSRTIVATEDYLGLAPDFTKCGDVIYIMSGCHTPVVLRPCGEGIYRFLGDIFLGSVQRGEDRMFPIFSSELYPDLEAITLV